MMRVVFLSLLSLGAGAGAGPAGHSFPLKSKDRLKQRLAAAKSRSYSKPMEGIPAGDECKYYGFAAMEMLGEAIGNSVGTGHWIGMDCGYDLTRDSCAQKSDVECMQVGNGCTFHGPGDCDITAAYRTLMYPNAGDAGSPVREFTKAGWMCHKSAGNCEAIEGCSMFQTPDQCEISGDALDDPCNGYLDSTVKFMMDTCGDMPAGQCNGMCSDYHGLCVPTESHMIRFMLGEKTGSELLKRTEHMMFCGSLSMDDCRNHQKECFPNPIEQSCEAMPTPFVQELYTKFGACMGLGEDACAATGHCMYASGDCYMPWDVNMCHETTHPMTCNEVTQMYKEKECCGHPEHVIDPEAGVLCGHAKGMYAGLACCGNPDSVFMRTL